jgi:hypothetical protein
LAYTVEGLYAHGSIDTPNPFLNSRNSDSTSGLPSESNVPTATGDNIGQALGQMAGPLEVGGNVTTDTNIGLYISGQDTAVKEVDEELDELDELDDGPWPLMTSDLDYPLESQAAEVKDGTSCIYDVIYFPLHSLHVSRQKAQGIQSNPPIPWQPMAILFLLQFLKLGIPSIRIFRAYIYSSKMRVVSFSR